uniref:Nucleotide-diphospho-sugar transferase domain-containing protein n=1 Tax=Parascaris univalens TaxID=6257 RepID=A0A915C9N3_PARUN
VFMRMNTKWGRRAVALLVSYSIIHLIVNMIDNRRVIERTEIPKRKDSDGPLIMKDIGDRKGKVLTSVYLMDSKPLISRMEELEMHPGENISHPLPPIPRAFIKKFEKIARSIQSRSDNFLLFTLVNRAYLNLTLNWLCNVAIFKSNIHTKTLIVNMDEESCKTIKKEWPHVSCLFFKVPNDYNAPLNWGRQNYINLLTLRSELMLNLVSLNIPYILFETDASWLRDPMKYFDNQTLIDDADIVVPTKGFRDRGQKYSFDPMIVYPTNGSRSLLNEMKKRLIADPKLFDQDVLEELCRQQYNGIVCRRFEWDDIADGKWFKLADAQRATIKPYIVNNNYYFL